MAAFTKSSQLDSYKSYYQSQQSCCAPSYVPYSLSTNGALTINSNTWVGGILLKAGYSQSDVNKIGTQLTLRSFGLIPYGYGNGFLLQSLF